MAWIQVVHEEQAQGRLREFYDKVVENRGKVANIFKVHSLNPDAMKAHMDLYLTIMYGSSGLSRAQREMIAVAVSAANECEYCIVHHSAALGRYVRDGAFVKQLSLDYTNAPLSSKDRVMLGYAVKLTKNMTDVGEEDVQNLRDAGFADEEILSITLVVSYFNFVNRIVEGLGVKLEQEGGGGYKY